MTKPVVVTIEIDREPAEVFAYTSDYRNEAEWQGNVVGLTADPPGPVTVGTELHKIRKTPMGMQVFTTQVTAIDPQTWTHADLIINGTFTGTTGRWSVEPTQRGARVELVADFKVRGAATLIAPLIRRIAAKNLQQEFRSLKRLLESPSNL